MAGSSDRIPRLYYADNYVLRRMFWQRLHRLNRLMNRTLESRGSCLDFGGGSGVLLPTLAGTFGEVTLVDLEARQAERVKERYGLNNVSVVEADVGSLDFRTRPFDAAVAADVLEHFPDLELPLRCLRDWIKPRGLLFTSLPTENWVYVFLRRVFGVEKPKDHFHTGYEVEARLRRSGFQQVATSCVPLHVPIAPLFLITAWRRE